MSFCGTNILLCSYPHFGEWLVTGWDACTEIGRLTDGGILDAGHPSDREFFGGNSVLNMSGEKQCQYREAVDRPLRPRAVNSYLAGDARKIVVEYIENIRPHGSADLTRDLFERISIRVIGNRLGLTEIADEKLVVRFHSLSGGLTNTAQNSETAEAAQTSLREIDETVGRIIERLSDDPDESIISHLLYGGLAEGAPPRSFADVMPTIRVIILGGFQEPGNAAANAFLGLFEEPEQLELLQSNPREMAAAAVHVSLRWMAPIGVVSRQARQPSWSGQAPYRPAHSFRSSSHPRIVMHIAMKDRRGLTCFATDFPMRLLASEVTTARAISWLGVWERLSWKKP